MDNLGKDNTLDKDNTIDIENDPEFNANFYKNIEKVLDSIDLPEEIQSPSIDILTEEEENDKKQQEEEAEETKETDMELADKPSAVQSQEAAAQADLADESGIEDELMDISSLLAKQVSKELDTGAAGSPQKKGSIFLLQNSALLTILCILGFCFF